MTASGFYVVGLAMFGLFLVCEWLAMRALDRRLRDLSKRLDAELDDVRRRKRDVDALRERVRKLLGDS